MVVLSDKPIRATSSYNLPLEPARPFWMLEYVSKNNKRKDYDDNFDKYEKELKVPYYLIFYPDDQELTLYHLRGKKYVSVKPNKHGRYPIRGLRHRDQVITRGVVEMTAALEELRSSKTR